MFLVLLAHPQVALHKTKLYRLHTCYVCWLHQDWSGTGVGDLILNKLNKMCITLVSLYWYSWRSLNLEVVNLELRQLPYILNLNLPL
jgi:hypothetical protein